MRRIHAVKQLPLVYRITFLNQQFQHGSGNLADEFGFVLRLQGCGGGIACSQLALHDEGGFNRLGVLCFRFDGGRRRRRGNVRASGKRSGQGEGHGEQGCQVGHGFIDRLVL